MVKKRKDCGPRALVSRSLFHPGSELVGPAELRKREHENKTGGIWEEKLRGRELGSLSLSFSFFLFPTPPLFRVPFTFASTPLSEAWDRLRFSRLRRSPLMHALTEVCSQPESVISRGVSDILPPLPSVCRHWRLLSCYTVSLVSVS